MAGSKRSLAPHDSDDGKSGRAAPVPPKKPAHLSSKFGWTTASPKTVSTLESDEDHGLDTGNRGRSSEKTLSSWALLQEVLKMAENEDTAELMILELMRKYSFRFSRFKDPLRRMLTTFKVTCIQLIADVGNNLEVSFSKYVDIAPLVGLEPALEGDDIPTFDMFRARLPNHIFNQIIKDLQVFTAQYGPLGKHKNEEARARYMSGVSSLAF